MDLEREIKRLLEKYPDPRLGVQGRIDFDRKQNAEDPWWRFGTVSDNRDPEKLGRIRVACDMIAPGAVTPWIPVIRPWASNRSGWWYLPDVGAQVLLGFVGGLSFPVALGCVYNEKNLPPAQSTENPANSILIQTKALAPSGRDALK